jgi:hypothetical protein
LYMRPIQYKFKTFVRSSLIPEDTGIKRCFSFSEVFGWMFDFEKFGFLNIPNIISKSLRQ